MLVLGGREDDRIIVEGPVTITIVRVQGNGYVKLGFEGAGAVWREKLKISGPIPPIPAEHVEAEE